MSEDILKYAVRVFSDGPPDGETLKDVMSRLEAAVLRGALRSHAYRMGEAADACGITREGFYKKRLRYGLEVRPTTKTKTREDLLDPHCPVCGAPTTATSLIKHRACSDCAEGEAATEGEGWKPPSR